MPDLDIYSLLKTELMVGIPDGLADKLGDMQKADMAARKYGLHPHIYFRNSNRLTVEKLLRSGRYGSFMARTHSMP